MSAFLAAFVEKILEWAVRLIAAAVSRWQAMKRTKEEIEKKNQEVLDVTEKAETKEERDHAADEITRNF